MKISEQMFRELGYRRVRMAIDDHPTFQRDGVIIEVCMTVCKWDQRTEKDLQFTPDEIRACNQVLDELEIEGESYTKPFWSTDVLFHKHRKMLAEAAEEWMRVCGLEICTFNTINFLNQNKLIPANKVKGFLYSTRRFQNYTQKGTANDLISVEKLKGILDDITRLQEGNYGDQRGGSAGEVPEDGAGSAEGAGEEGKG